MPGQTIAELLACASSALEIHSDTAKLDADLLLAHCLDKNRAHLYTWPEKIPADSQREQFLALLLRRAEGVPLAYLTGTREFWSMPFQVTTDTLVPRPETELVVQLAVDLLNTKTGAALDLGTGCGAIAISIAHECTQLDVDAVDQSDRALDVAKSNALSNGVTVRFIKSNWFSNVDRRDYRVIVSNPPYIAESDPHLKRGGLQYEPITALRANDNGMADIAFIVANASAYLQNKGWLLIEHGATQGDATRRLMHNAGLLNIRTERDLESRERVTLGRKS